ncbi:MAG: tRNA (adenosine(37)-N6)-dimethylallyltransferase MiaA [Planctomycetes bacterium]|nr:tRNA (adenosine(37)-N6)-dimethylallyltransferase MiaA [Planctomycetota bacterium]
MPIEPFQNALILTGPTASGKSELALHLAERVNAEIIALDSMTLYRGMDIGTAKPTVEERRRIPHHLIDVLDPWESGNVAWWLREAAACSREIESRGRQVLFVGGTPFYLKALLQGLFEGPPVDPVLRSQLEQEAARNGSDAIHARLAMVDPVTAKRLHPNDVRRVVRALEIWHQTGKPISECQQQGWWGPVSRDAESSKRSDETPRCLVLDLPRDELYTRINRRVEKMIEAGWIDEVRRLRELPRPMSKEASGALGYREIAAFLDDQLTLPAAIEAIQLRSRQFAKRQLTWFRSLPGCQLCEGKLTFDLWKRKIS